MATKAQIITAMQFDFVSINDLTNDTGAAFQLTYQFATNSQPGDLFYSYSGWTAMTSAEKAALRSAFAYIETFLNVDFIEVTGDSDPDLNLGKVDLPPSVVGQGGASVSYAGSSIVEWDGFAVYDNATNLASGQRHLILHELGHALGLDHPFEGATLPTAQENNHYTAMSYTADPESGRANNAMMLYDILALQDIWGRAPNATGDTFYGGRGNFDVRVVWDTGGTDTFTARKIGHSVTLDLRQGRFSTFGSYEDVVVAFGVKIENATGSAYADTLNGNALSNKVVGLSGNDRMFGFSGNDELLGGAGNDRMAGGLGADLLSGGTGNDALLGGQGDDTLYGQKGNDLLQGNKGADRLFGGEGADTFLFRAGDGQDRIVDFADNTDRLKILGYGSKADVLDAASNHGNDVLFDFGNGDTLVVRNMTIAALTDDLLVS